MPTDDPDIRDKSSRGNASQFFIAGELCRRGYSAVITLGNTPNVGGKQRGQSLLSTQSSSNTDYRQRTNWLRSPEDRDQNCGTEAKRPKGQRVVSLFLPCLRARSVTQIRFPLGGGRQGILFRLDGTLARLFHPSGLSRVEFNVGLKLGRKAEGVAS